MQKQKWKAEVLLSEKESLLGLSYCSKHLKQLLAKLKKLKDEKHNLEVLIKNVKHEISITENKRKVYKKIKSIYEKRNNKTPN